MEFIELRFTVNLDGADSLKLPFLGATLRGALGYVLKEISCQVRHGRCPECTLAEVCPYTCLFEGRPPSRRTIMRKYPAVPQPFVLVVPPIYSPPQPKKLTWSVRLFGSACRFWSYLVYAFQRIGECGIGRNRVPYTLVDVTDARSGHVVWNARRAVVAEPHPFSMDALPSLPEGRCVLRWSFQTPLKLRLSGDKLTGLDLVSAGRRRYEIMNYFYGSGEDCPNPSEPRWETTDFVTRNACLRRWNLRRFSGRQKRVVEFYGLVGDIEIEGPWGRCGPWLQAAPVLHLGKATSFGYGRVTWEVVA